MCRVLFPIGHKDVFQKISLSEVMHLCTIVHVAYNRHGGLLRKKLRSLASLRSKKCHDPYVCSLSSLLESHVPRIVFGFRNVENQTANADVSIVYLCYVVHFSNSNQPYSTVEGLSRRIGVFHWLLQTSKAPQIP